MIKKILSKTVSVQTLLIVALITSMSFVMIGAAATSVTATLSPEIKVVYNGETQSLRDGSGNTVYPLVYNGSTYLPVRAVSNILGVPVNWESATRSVLIGETPSGPAQTRLIDAIEGKQYAYKATTDPAHLISGYSFGMRSGGHSYMYVTKDTYKLNDAYSKVKFDWTLVMPEEIKNNVGRLVITDKERGIELFNDTITVADGIKTIEVNIAGVQSIEFSASGGGAGDAANNRFNMLILEPYLFK